MNSAFSFFMFITLVLSGIVLSKEDILNLLIKEETKTKTIEQNKKS